jgi:two-component sensor histidine kinase
MILADIAAVPLTVTHQADNSLTVVIGAAALLIPLMSAVLALFITRREAEAGKREIEQRIEKLEHAIEESTKQSSTSRQALYQHVTGVRQELSNMAEQNRRELSLKIDTIPGLVIAMLNNTGAINPHR